MTISLCKMVTKVNIICIAFATYLIFAGDIKNGMLVMVFTFVMLEVRDVMTHAHVHSIVRQIDDLHDIDETYNDEQA